MKNHLYLFQHQHQFLLFAHVVKTIRVLKSAARSTHQAFSAMQTATAQEEQETKEMLMGAVLLIF